MERKGLDVLLLFVLVMARVRIDTLSDMVLPTRHQDLLRLPWIGRLFSPEALDLLQDWLTDPLSLLLISLTFAGVLCYVLVDLFGQRIGARWAYRLKLTLLFLIIGTTVIAGSLKLTALRHEIGPASYSHDGGVIQTEEAVKLFLAGQNPYVEDYADTPLAEWGIDFRSAIYHYPYLPWTFVFSAPGYLLSQAVLGWFDQRFVYLILFVLTLLMASQLTENRIARLALVMLLGLNPIMGSDVIFGQNDSFVLFWIVLALWLLPRHADERHSEWRYGLSACAAGLACASKPTAWFLMPFYIIALLDVRWSQGRLHISRRWVTRALPLVAVLAILLVPYLAWDAPAMIDDVWKWSSGTSEVPYQIRGWGLSNWVLALELVDSRLGYFPFWLPELLLSLPLLAILAWRQLTAAGPEVDQIARAARYGAILLFAYSFVSRFFNENYVGFIAALLAIGILTGWPLSAHDQETSLT